MRRTAHEPSDHDLVMRTIEGDTSAFGDLVHRHAALAYAVARSRVRDQATAADVVQEAFAVAFERLGQLRAPDRFAPWLRKLVVAECARLTREEQRSSKQAAELAAVAAVAEVAHGRLLENDGDLGRAAIRLLDELPPAQREAAEICLVREVSRAAAASFLGIEEGTLRKRLHDARRKLQAEVFRIARDTLREDQLPAGFERRCVCRCERSKKGKKR
jgi:RNA polymerase sigma-70 factor (ECF subfamily)